MSLMHPTTGASAEHSKKDAESRLHHYEKTFEDPEDVVLLKEDRILSEEDRKRESNLSVAQTTGSKRYCGIMFSLSGGNQRRIFLAVRFLVRRFHDMCTGEQADLSSRAMTKGGSLYTRLAIDLESTEPSLKGVTGLALYATIERLCLEYDSYEKDVALMNGDLTFTSRLLELCRLLRNSQRVILRNKETTSEIAAEKRTHGLDHTQYTHKKRKADNGESGNKDDDKDGCEYDEGLVESDQSGSEDGRIQRVDPAHPSPTPYYQQQEQLQPVLPATPLMARSRSPPQNIPGGVTMRMPRGFAKEQRRIAEEQRKMIEEQRKMIEEQRKATEILASFESALLTFTTRIEESLESHQRTERAILGVGATLHTLKMDILDIHKALRRNASTQPQYQPHSSASTRPQFLPSQPQFPTTPRPHFPPQQPIISTTSQSHVQIEPQMNLQSSQ